MKFQLFLSEAYRTGAWVWIYVLPISRDLYQRMAERINIVSTPRAGNQGNRFCQKGGVGVLNCRPAQPIFASHQFSIMVQNTSLVVWGIRWFGILTGIYGFFIVATRRRKHSWNSMLKKNFRDRRRLPINNVGDFLCIWINEDVVKVQVRVKKRFRVQLLGKGWRQIRREDNIPLQKRNIFLRQLRRISWPIIIHARPCMCFSPSHLVCPHCSHIVNSISPLLG